jgi:hypothetical protein
MFIDHQTNLFGQHDQVSCVSKDQVISAHLKLLRGQIVWKPRDVGDQFSGNIPGAVDALRTESASMDACANVLLKPGIKRADIKLSECVGMPF